MKIKIYELQNCVAVRGAVPCSLMTWFIERYAETFTLIDTALTNRFGCCMVLIRSADPEDQNVATFDLECAFGKESA